MADAEGSSCELVGELQAVLAQACAALQAQDAGNVQEAVQGYYLARSRVHYVAQALLRPLLEEASAGGSGDTDDDESTAALAVAAATCGVLQDTFAQAVERLSCAPGSTQLSSEGWDEGGEGTQLRGGDAGQLERRHEGRLGGGTAGAVAARCMREVPPGSLDEVVGLDAIKQELREAVLLPMALPHLFTGIRRPQTNVLLFGVPGTGKTLLAEKLAAEAGAPLLCLSPSAVLSKWAGESEKGVRAVFEAAAAAAPALIFIDEVDALAPARASGDDLAARRVLTELLLQMTAATSRTGAPPVFVLAATNRPLDCDDALLRRFDRRIEVPPPDCAARAAFFTRAAARPEVAAALSAEELAALVAATEGCTGSDLSVMCREAAMAPLRELMRAGALAGGGKAVSVRPVTAADFGAAVAKLRAQP